MVLTKDHTSIRRTGSDSNLNDQGAGNPSRSCMTCDVHQVSPTWEERQALTSRQLFAAAARHERLGHFIRALPEQLQTSTSSLAASTGRDLCARRRCWVFQG